MSDDKILWGKEAIAAAAGLSVDALSDLIKDGKIRAAKFKRGRSVPYWTTLRTLLEDLDRLKSEFFDS